MNTPLMVQGTTSDAGKSILVTGLCRVLARRGLHVAPFKPQNMALNSAVTPEGGEIGRAQALQAQAAGVAPHTDMNPVLLKPSSDCQAQVIVHGQVAADLDAVDYHQYKTRAMAAVMASWARLRRDFDTVIVEGAGSPAEINLRDRDIANMGFAEAADCPVILVADIDRGGVFAHLVGTLALLSESEQARVQGFVINRFRGDISLLQPGLDWLEEETGKPVLGVVPFLPGLQLDAEDALENVEQAVQPNALKVIAPVLPRISNSTDFDALKLHPDIDFQFVDITRTPPPADLVILPGSKNVRADLRHLRDHGWETYLARHLRYGGSLLGICGGYQMLGDRIADPDGVEGPPGSTPGLGLLPLDTRLYPAKQLSRSTFDLAREGDLEVYEIHCGSSEATAPVDPWLVAKDGVTEGHVSGDRQVAGTYFHGLFDTPAGLAHLVRWMGRETTSVVVDRDALREQAIDRLADCLEECLDLRRLFPITGTAT